jgi:hypothetical protein
VVVKPRKQWQLDRWAEAVWERLKIVKSAQSGFSSLSFISSRLRAFACDHQTVAELLKGIRNWCITRRREDAKGFLFARPSPKLRSFAEFRV